MKRFAHSWGLHFLRNELGLAVALTTTFAIWLQTGSGRRAVEATLGGTRAPLYGVLATIWGSLLGFVIATVAIVLGFADSDRLTIVKGSDQYPTLWTTFLSAIRWTAFATVAALVALILDHDSPGSANRLALDFVTLTSLVAAFRLARCIWILQALVELVVRPSKARPGNAP
jgi:hypothetical protein